MLTTKKHLEMAISKKAENENDAYSQPASAISRIEIHNTAAVGQMQKLVADQIIEAFKTGQRDSQHFLKEMRPFFP